MMLRSGLPGTIVEVDLLAAEGGKDAGGADRRRGLGVGFLRAVPERGAFRGEERFEIAAPPHVASDRFQLRPRANDGADEGRMGGRETLRLPARPPLYLLEALPGALQPLLQPRHPLQHPASQLAEQDDAVAAQ